MQRPRTAGASEAGKQTGEGVTDDAPHLALLESEHKGYFRAKEGGCAALNGKEEKTLLISRRRCLL